MTFQFKIQIKNISKPPVWRKLTVPASFTFWDFHVAIQIAFGWYNEHMFQFSPQGYRSYPQIKLKFDDDLEDDLGFSHGEILDAEKTKLSDIFKEENQKFTYIYDFGDDWVHNILLEKISDKRMMHPVCLAGKGTCPPEDCGGPWGYENLKELLSGPKCEESTEIKEWLGMEDNEEWNANLVDIEEANLLMSEVFRKK